MKLTILTMADGDLVSDFTVECPADIDDFDAKDFTDAMQTFLDEYKESKHGKDDDASEESEDVDKDDDDDDEETTEESIEEDDEVEVPTDDVVNIDDVEVEVDDAEDAEDADLDDAEAGDIEMVVIKRLYDEEEVSVRIADVEENELYVQKLEIGANFVKFQLIDKIYKISGLPEGTTTIAFAVQSGDDTYNVDFNIVENDDSDVAATISKAAIEKAEELESDEDELEPTDIPDGEDTDETNSDVDLNVEQ